MLLRDRRDDREGLTVCDGTSEGAEVIVLRDEGVTDEVVVCDLETAAVREEEELAVEDREGRIEGVVVRVIVGERDTLTERLTVEDAVEDAVAVGDRIFVIVGDPVAVTVCVIEIDGDVELDLEGRCVEVVVTLGRIVRVGVAVGGIVEEVCGEFVWRGEEVLVLDDVVVREDVIESCSERVGRDDTECDGEELALFDWELLFVAVFVTVVDRDTLIDLVPVGETREDGVVLRVTGVLGVGRTVTLAVAVFLEALDACTDTVVVRVGAKVAVNRAVEVCEGEPRVERLTDADGVCERVGLLVLLDMIVAVIERLARLDRVGSLVGNKERVGREDGVICCVGTGLLDGRILAPARCLK